MVAARVRTVQSGEQDRCCCRSSRRGRTSARRWTGRRSSIPVWCRSIEQRFVAVRVDADRRPDINDRYNLGGWPTTVFLTDARRCPERRYLSRRGRAWPLSSFRSPTRIAIAPMRLPCVPAEYGLLAFRPAPAAFRQTVPCVIPAFRPAATMRWVNSVRCSSTRFDAVHGGFGTVPKLPHPYALLLALSLAGSGDTRSATSLSSRSIACRRCGTLPLVDFIRYADSADWSWPGTEKTLEDNAALLQVYVEAALQLRDERCREQAGAIVRWTKGAMSDEEHGGFFNAVSHRGIDKTMYVDRNAMMVGCAPASSGAL